jgi:hypothetical protein
VELLECFPRRRPGDDEPEFPECHALDLKLLDQQAEDSTLLGNAPNGVQL